MKAWIWFVFTGWCLGQTPTASILSPGSDFTYVRGQEVFLFGFGDQADLQFKWTTSTGRTLEGASVSFTLTEEEPFTVTMIATNGRGESSTPDNRILYPIEPFDTFLQPTITRITPSLTTVNPNMTFTLEAQFTDPDGDDPVRFHWFWLQDGLPQRATGSPLKLKLNPNELPTNISLSLIVTDRKGHSSFPSFTNIAVQNGNLPPSASIAEPPFSLINVLEGQEVTFRAEGVDPENDLPIRYQWLLPDQSTQEGNPIKVIFKEAGFQSVILNATDGLGNRNAIGTSITVSVVAPEDAEPPFASIVMPVQPTRIFENEALILAGFAPEDAMTQWTVTNLVSGATYAQFEGTHPGRVNFSEAGLYQIRLEATNLGLTTPPGQGNTRWLSVQKRDGNQAPTLRHRDGFQHYVKNGGTLELEALVEDPDKDGVKLFWAVDGAILPGGDDRQTVSFQLDEDAFFQGLSFRNVVTLAVDDLGKAPPRPLYHAVTVYEDDPPPIPSANGLAPGTTVYLPINQPYNLKSEVENPGRKNLNYTWRALYLGELDYFYESTDMEPPPLTPPKKGIIFLELAVETEDGTLRGQPYSLYIHAFNPEEVPRTVITKPVGSPVRAEPGIPILLEGLALEPNFLASPLAGIDFTQPVTNQLTWEVKNEQGQVELFSQNEPLNLVLETPGTYEVNLKTENNIGLQAVTPASLKVEVSGPLPDAAFEPNDVREDAALIQGGRYGGFSVGPEDPVDWYRFSLETAGATIELQFDLTESGDGLSLQFFREEVLVREYILEAGLNHPVQFTGASAGDYFLRLATLEGQSRSNTPPLKGTPGFSYSFSVGVSVPRLTFSYTKNDEVDQTLLTLVNPGGELASVTLTAFGDGGVTVAEAAFDLAANGHLEQSITQFFPGVDSIDIRWIQASSDRQILGLSTTIALDEETAVAEQAAFGNFDELIIPHIAQRTDQWFTRAAIANTSASSLSAAFSAKAGDFSIPELEGTYQGSLIDFEAFFGGELPQGSEWGRVVEETAQPHLGGMELFGTKQGEPRIAALSLTSETFANPNFTYTNRDIYFPHVARDTRSFWTAIAFVNTSGDPVDIALIAYGDEGQVLAQEPITMDPFGKEVGIVHNLFSQLDATAEISWVRLQSTGPVAGYELFGDNTGNDRRLAGFPAIRGGSKEVIFQKILYTPGVYYTGLAAVNLSGTQTASLEYRAYGQDGTLLATVSDRTIGPFQKDVTTVEAIFGGTLPEGTCWVRLTSTQPLAAFELFGDNAGKFLAGATAQ